MEQNILLVKKKEDLISEKQVVVSLLNGFINEGDVTTDELKELQDSIKQLEDEIFVINEDRIYLVDKDDNDKIVIDFWEEYEVVNVIEIDEDGYQLISISFEDGNCTDCICLVDYDGNTIVPSCIDYAFFGDEIGVAQRGYMIGKDFYSVYWSIVYSEEIFGVDSIEYLEDDFIFLVDETKIYNERLEYVGEKIDVIAEGYIIFKNDKCYGVMYEGDILIDYDYNIIEAFYDCNSILLRTLKSDGVTWSVIIINTDNQIEYQRDYNSESKMEYQSVLKGFGILDENENTYFFYFKKNDTVVAVVYDRFTKEEVEFVFDSFHYLYSPTLSDIVLCCGTNKSSNSNTIFLNSIDNPKFDTSHFCKICSYYYYIIIGSELEKDVPIFLNAELKFNPVVDNYIDNILDYDYDSICVKRIENSDLGVDIVIESKNSIVIALGKISNTIDGDLIPNMNKNFNKTKELLEARGYKFFENENFPEFLFAVGNNEMYCVEKTKGDIYYELEEQFIPYNEFENLIARRNAHFNV